MTESGVKEVNKNVDDSKERETLKALAERVKEKEVVDEKDIFEALGLPCYEVTDRERVQF